MKDFYFFITLRRFFPSHACRFALMNGRNPKRIWPSTGAIVMAIMALSSCGFDDLYPPNGYPRAEHSADYDEYFLPLSAFDFHNNPRIKSEN